MKTNLFIVVLSCFAVAFGGCAMTPYTIRACGGPVVIGNILSVVTSVNFVQPTSILISNQTHFYDEVMIMDSVFRIPPGGSITDSWHGEFDHSQLSATVWSYSDPSYNNLTAVGGTVLNISNGEPTSWQIGLSDLRFLDGSYQSGYWNSPYPQSDFRGNQEVNIPTLKNASVSVTEVVNGTMFDLAVVQASSESKLAIPYIIEISRKGKANVGIIKPGGIYRTITGGNGQSYNGIILLNITVLDRGRVKGYTDPVRFYINSDNGNGPSAQQRLITFNDIRYQ